MINSIPFLASIKKVYFRLITFIFCNYGILIAINDLQNIKRGEIVNKIKTKKPISVKKSDIPSNTLKLIEEAEEIIKSKMQSG